MKGRIILLLFLFLPVLLYGQNWTLKKYSEGIKVYTGSTPNTNIKAIKVTCLIKARLSQLAALLLDIRSHTQWTYNAKSCHLVKKISAGHVVYYTEIKMPWPLNNRDVVTDMNITQQLPSKTMNIDAVSTDDYLPAKKGIVRVPMMKINWKVTPADHGQISVEYTAQVDPGGEIPAWVVNSFSTNGPLKTFKKIRSLVATAPYRDAAYSFIKN